MFVVKSMCVVCAGRSSSDRIALAAMAVSGFLTLFRTIIANKWSRVRDMMNWSYRHRNVTAVR